MPSRRFIIDTDTASDDAVALIMALQHPDVQVEAITVVSGNVPLEQGSINACYTVELCGKETPVYEGAARPLLRAASHAEWFHGPDGLGDMHYPAPKRAPAGQDAIQQLVRRFGEAPGEITLFGLAGTLTIDLPGRRVQLGAGDFLHLARGVPHAVHAADAARALLTICLHRERPGATNRQDGA